MASDLFPVVPKRQPALPLRTTNEARFWASFQVKENFRMDASVTHVVFAPVAPHDLAITASAKVTVVDGRSNRIGRTLGSFKDTAYSASFKKDGRLLVAGCENGSVQVFDVQRRATLRTLYGHSSAVRTAMFSVDGLRVLTGSDDKTARMWDLPTATTVATLDGHGDYVRAQAPSMASPHLWATGSYDHTLRLYDLRKQAPIFSLDHGYPIEAVLLLPGGGLAVSAGGPEVRIHDLFAGGRVLRRLQNHAKAATCLSLDGNGTRLLTGGLDQQIKVHDLNTYDVGASMYFNGQVLSLDVSPDNSRLAAGLASGECCVKKFTHKAEEERPEVEGLAARRKTEEAKMFMELARGKTAPSVRAPRPGSRKFYRRGTKEQAVPGDRVVGSGRPAHPKEYDVMLRKFMYGAALDKAMAKGRVPITAAVIEELIHRDGLRIALSNRGAERLVPVLQLVEKNVADARYAEVMLLVADTVLDLYGKIVGRSAEVDRALERLHKVVQTELRTENDMLRLLGMMNTTLASSRGQQLGDMDDID